MSTMIAGKKKKSSIVKKIFLRYFSGGCQSAQIFYTPVPGEHSPKLPDITETISKNRVKGSADTP